ncbi:hypothetical protein DFR86_00540 [Acidianus sulfidivorans JP7]|uniref:Uncharacterized protein n=1 Tax=Acidianus sulfidivorans JP7 TaxID=619593 RepID=A0A2U9IJH8_9CREN|nr:hypothetical protein [Acidianus sulfidivorans]AWR96182.1 hypothetical protein DFR86_00540 [Acidianus sulfidivorans JP7]
MRVKAVLISLTLPMIFVILVALGAIIPYYQPIQMSITNAKIVYPGIVSFELKAVIHDYFGCFYYFNVTKFLYNNKSYAVRPENSFYSFDGKPNSFSVGFYMPSKLFAKTESDKNIPLTIIVNVTIITSLNQIIHRVYTIDYNFTVVKY